MNRPFLGKNSFETAWSNYVSTIGYVTVPYDWENLVT